MKKKNKKIDRKINARVRSLNNQLKQDVFGDRFWVRQKQKIETDGIRYYLYELCDREEPQRNRIIDRGWLTDFSILTFQDLWLEMNSFIVTSDFWTQYNEKEMVKNIANEL